MDEQNKNAETTPLPANPVQGGQEVVRSTNTPEQTSQPHPVVLDGQQIAEQDSSLSQTSVSPASATNLQAPIQQQNSDGSTSIITGGEAPTGQTFSSSSYEHKTKRHWLPLGILASVLLIIVIMGVLFGTNYNLRATVLNSKFRQYSYENDGTPYKLMFFKNSIIEKDPAVANSNDNFIVSPPNVDGALPIQLGVIKAQPTVTTSEINAGESCMAKNVTLAFTVYIPAAGHNINVCSATSPDFNSNTYIATYKNPTTNGIYSVAVGVSFDVKKLTTNITYANQVNSEVAPITSYQSDIKHILNSISN